jgi:MFS family permease
VIALSLARIAFAFTLGIYSTRFAIYLEKSLNFPLSMISLLYSFSGLANVLIRIPSGKISDKIGRKYPLMLSYGIYVVVFILVIYARSFPLLVLAMTLYGMGMGMQIIPSSTMLSESVSFEDRPMSFAIFLTVYEIGYIIGALIAGLTAMLSFTTLLSFLSVPVMTSAIVILLLFSKETFI